MPNDRKKIREWAKKNNYRLLVVILPKRIGERMGFAIVVRNNLLDKDIELFKHEKFEPVREQALYFREFFNCPVEYEGFERPK
jgi:hypothetical protein